MPAGRQSDDTPLQWVWRVAAQGVAWVKQMTWQGIYPRGALSRSIQRGWH